MIHISNQEPRNEVAVEVRFPQPRALLFIVERVRRMLDLTADPVALEYYLSLDPLLRRLVKNNPGVRIPGAWDGFETAVLAILGQRETPGSAARTGGRLAATFGRVVKYGGGLQRVFPTAQQLATVDVERAGIKPMAALAIRALASKASNGSLTLNACIDVQAAVADLATIPGVSRLTIEYIMMRGMGEPDAFQLELRRVLREDLKLERWRPWRAYAAMLLWHDQSAQSCTQESLGSGSISNGPTTSH